MKNRLSKRVASLEPSMSLAISAKAAYLKEQGLDIISLSIGEPDFFTPDYIKKAGINAINNNKTGYTASSGTLELRETISKKIKKDLNLNYEANQIVVSSGAKHSITSVLLAIAEEGDEIIIPAPYWVSYPEMVKLTGAKPVIIKTKEENKFKVTRKELDVYTNENTKALFLNSPSNPTGTAYDKEDLVEIADWAYENDVFIISDEVYSKILFTGSHYSIASIDKVKNLTFLINGASKAYSMTGWRIGYTAGPIDIINSIDALQSQMTSNPNTIAQYAAETAFKCDDIVIDDMVTEFKKRRDYCFERINNMEGLSTLLPDGAFYLLINISGILNKIYNNKKIENSIDVSNFFLDEAQLAFVPGIGFGDDNYIRMSFATSMENLIEAMNRMEKALKVLK